MKKGSKILKNKIYYSKKMDYKEISYVEFQDKTLGLIDEENNKIILRTSANSYINYDSKYSLILIMDRDSNKLYIYDILNRYLIISGDIIIRRVNNIYILEDKDSKKLYLYDEIFCRNRKKEMFDSIIPIDRNYFKVVIGNKMGLYSLLDGLVTDIKYDNIELLGDKNRGKSNFVLTTGVMKEVFSSLNKEIIPSVSDEVTSNGDIIILTNNKRNNKHCELYYYDEENKNYNILDMIIYTSISSMLFNHGTGYIIYKYGNKYYIKMYKDYCKIPVLKWGYDDICVHDNYISKMEVIASFNEYIDKFIHLGGNYYYVLDDKFGKIIRLIDGEYEVVFSLIEEFICPNDNQDMQYIYTKNGKKGIISVSANGNLFISNEYDYVCYIDYKYAIVGNGDKKGVIYDGKLIIDINYDEIKFLKDIIVLKNKEHILVKDYQNNLLATFPSSTVISMEEETNSYLVDKEKWIYKSGTFKRMTCICEYEYIRGYQYKYGTIVVNSTDKDKYDRDCAFIEGISSDSVESLLYSYYKVNKDLFSKHSKKKLRKK